MSNQNLTRLRRLFYGVESTEGTRVAGTATTAILPVSLSTKPNRKFNKRKFVGQMGSYTGNMGEYEPSLTMGFELRASGTNGTASDLDKLYLTAMGASHTDTGASTFSAISGTAVTVASSSNFTAGNVVLLETDHATGIYEACLIAAVPDGTHLTLTKTPSSAVNTAPAGGANVKPSITYALANTGHGSLTFDLYDVANGGAGAAQFRSFLGCKGNMKIDANGPGVNPMVSFDWMAISQTTATNGTVPAQTIGDTGTPTVALSSVFKLDSTRTDIRSFSLDLGAQIGRKKSQNSTYGTFGEVVTDYDPKGKISLYNTDYTQYSAWEAGTAAYLSWQVGTALGGIVAVVMPNALRVSVGDGADGEMVTDEIDFEADLTTGLDQVYLAIG